MEKGNIPLNRTTSLGSKYALAGILENYNTANPIDLKNKIPLTEDDSNKLIDKLSSAIKFKEINSDNNHPEKVVSGGSDDKTIELDEEGNYTGKGKTTIYNRNIDLENPENSTERWVETSTGKVSDGETEQVPNPQGFDNLNESEEPLVEATIDYTPTNIIKNILNFNR